MEGDDQKCSGSRQKVPDPQQGSKPRGGSVGSSEHGVAPSELPGCGWHRLLCYARLAWLKKGGRAHHERPYWRPRALGCGSCHDSNQDANTRSKPARSYNDLAWDVTSGFHPHRQPCPMHMVEWIAPPNPRLHSPDSVVEVENGGTAEAPPSHSCSERRGSVASEWDQGITKKARCIQEGEACCDGRWRHVAAFVRYLLSPPSCVRQPVQPRVQTLAAVLVAALCRVRWRCVVCLRAARVVVGRGVNPSAPGARASPSLCTGTPFVPGTPRVVKVGV